ncbi:MAG TPA: hypothetical protein VEZ11_13910, partial [Thermoanaerobaculia bacterium]|nr:hypothetical protein [Thermoanaerobaculia bacterium]
AMWNDPIVEETHKIRRELADEFKGDVHAYFEYLRERERARGQSVTLDPAAPEPAIEDQPLRAP